MEFNLSLVDVHTSIISSVIGYDHDPVLEMEHKESISIVQRALTFMATHNFAYYVTDFNVVVNNLDDVSRSRLLESLNDLRKLAAKNTGLTAKSSEAFLYKLALELIALYGSSLENTDPRMHVYISLCCIFGETVDSKASLDALVFLLDFYEKYYYCKPCKIGLFLKEGFYPIGRKELSLLFRRTNWTRSTKAQFKRDYDVLIGMIDGFIHGRISVLELIEDVC